MTADLFPLEDLGTAVGVGDLASPLARALASYLDGGLDAEAELVGCCRDDAGLEAVVLRTEVARPQRPAADIGHSEVLAARFATARRHPVLLALRRTFPDTPHQNPTHRGRPRSPCVDDRPWEVAAADWTPFGFVQRIRWWLAEAAHGRLSALDQALDPLLVGIGPDLLVPASLLAKLGEEKEYVISRGGTPEDPAKCVHLREASDVDQGVATEFAVLHVEVPPRPARAIRLPPANLLELIEELDSDGFALRPVVAAWVKARLDEGRPLTPRLVLLLDQGVSRDGGAARDATDLKAFASKSPVGDIGTALGFIAPEQDRRGAWVRLLAPAAPDDAKLAEVALLAMPVSLEFDAALAREAGDAGGEDGGKVVLVGAGAVGSHVAASLAREGRFRWAVADEDWVRPHNLARHVLGRGAVGRPKASAVAQYLAGLLASPVEAIKGDVMEPPIEASLRAAGADATFILDASASVPVARHLSDADLGPARRLSVFLNPVGTAAVLLAEDRGRGVRLDALEARYYRMLLRDPDLEGHLAAPPGGFRYAAACRALSARIPESRVAALSALAARGVVETLAAQGPSIRVWSLRPSGRVDVVFAEGGSVREEVLAGWRVLLDAELEAAVAARRRAALPDETGGVLVGVFDAMRRAVSIVDALPPPPDSRGTPREFVRGVDGLPERLAAVARRTGGMVRYVGEWHTHPRGHRALPSSTDMAQLLALRAELRREGLPATMLIAGDDGIGVAQLHERGGDAA